MLLGELDNQDAVLGGERDQHHKPDLTVEIEVQPGNLDAEVGPEHTDHDRQQHRNRDRPTFIQRHQEQIGEQHRERENNTGLAGRLLLLIGGASPFETVARRQRCIGDLRHGGERRPRRDARRRAAVHGDRAVIVVAGDDLRSGHDLDAGDGTDWHHLADAVAHIDLPDVRNVAAIGCLALNVDLPGTAVEIEVVDVDSAERRLQRGEHVAHVEAERLSLGAVDVEIDRRIGGREGREYAREPRVAVGGGNQPAGDAAYRGRVLPLQRFELVLEAAAGREPDDRRQIERQHVGLPDLRATGERAPD